MPNLKNKGYSDTTKALGLLIKFQWMFLFCMIELRTQTNMSNKILNTPKCQISIFESSHT